MTQAAMFVKAWNGKWHLLDRTIGTEPAVPGGPGTVAKVARPIIITKCGLQAFARRFSGDTLVVHRSKMKCANCWSMIKIKYPVAKGVVPPPMPVPPTPEQPPAPPRPLPLTKAQELEAGLIRDLTDDDDDSEQATSSEETVASLGTFLAT